MRIVFTFHAEEKLIERNFSKRQIIWVIYHPDRIIFVDKTEELYKEHGHLFLKVVIERKTRCIVVITIHFIDQKRVT